MIASHERDALLNSDLIPQEDIGIYLTAHNGQARYFISSNRELIRALVEKTGEFECFTPQEFVEKYLR